MIPSHTASTSQNRLEHKFIWLKPVQPAPCSNVCIASVYGQWSITRGRVGPCFFHGGSCWHFGWENFSSLCWAVASRCPKIIATKCPWHPSVYPKHPIHFQMSSKGMVAYLVENHWVEQEQMQLSFILSSVNQALLSAKQSFNISSPLIKRYKLVPSLNIFIFS